MAEAYVLIVDDDKELLETVGERLRNRDIFVDTASNGAEALAKIAAHTFDAIVLDLMMPELDGMETLKRALKKKPDLQIILLTGHASVQHGVEAMREGALDFMEKPADLDVLVEKIKEGRERRMKIDAQTRENAVREALRKYSW
ncbi:chemotaxis protein CheY [Desulfocarbo indianensis]|nr:chemotaxis protein CheY [Desulfocarbo indianensis]